MEAVFKPWWASKAVWAGVLAAMGGILQTSYGFVLSPDMQTQLINVAFGIVGILAGGGSIYGRIVAAIPIATKAAKTIAELRKQLRENQALLQQLAAQQSAG